jgi:hypothetical protein
MEGLYGRHSWAGNTRTGKASKKGTTFAYVLIALACAARDDITLIMLLGSSMRHRVGGSGVGAVREIRLDLIHRSTVVNQHELTCKTVVGSM